ncbi:MAG: aminotransferase class V-fold PLP-dependent enzyme, partial [Planctomycetes bacterium]|nr:aminotransferase class V-fold PLP-dependent enzyme [Planctomycetota bacterium]
MSGSTHCGSHSSASAHSDGFARSSAPFASADTLCAHAGAGFEDGEPLAAPLILSTTFCQRGLAGSDGNGSRAAHRYSRESNPTVAALEQALAALEDAPHALSFTTGLAAETALFLGLLQSGDHVVCSRALYGGTTRLLQRILSPFGLRSTFVDTADLAATAAAFEARTKLLFVETPANPTLALSDLRALAQLAHARGALLAVDNTFLTPVLQRPLDLGADLTVSSTTKFVDGHSTALGGVIVTRDPALHERLFFLRKCTGAIQSPFQAWLTLQGLKTLPLRLRRQSESAARIADHLAAHPEVRVLHYPPRANAALAAHQHLGAHGAVLSFELAGGYERARAFVRHVRLCRLVEHVGSVETLLTHSASMTHAGVPREERERIGIAEGLLRLSVGLEEPS